MNLTRSVAAGFVLLAVVVGGCAAPSAAPGPAAAGAGAPSSAQAGGQTIVAISPASPPPQTLPQWLGINDLFGGVGALDRQKHQLLACLLPNLATNLPFLDSVPPVLPVTDPANLKPDAPAVAQAAAQAQADENAAPQKIKAIQALARIGCSRGRPKVEEGFLAALDDPTESVRFAAVAALRDLGGSPCETCKSNACCTPAIYKKLDRLAHRMNDRGCYEEPSARVRRVAALALENCGAPPPQPAPPAPIEGPKKPEQPPKPNVEGPPSPLPEAPAPKQAAKRNTSPVATKAQGPELAMTSPEKPDYSKPPVPDIVPTQDQSGERRPVQTAGLQRKPGNKPAVVPADRRTATEGVATDAGDHNENPPAIGAVRWESVTARFAQFRSRSRAWANIAYFRKRALNIHGKPPAGFHRNKLTVRTHGWTLPKDVHSQPLKRALQSLPVGRVSSVLEDGEGYHLVRVLQRHLHSDASVSEAQPSDRTAHNARTLGVPPMPKPVEAPASIKVIPERATTAGTMPAAAQANPVVPDPQPTRTDAADPPDGFHPFPADDERQRRRERSHTVPRPNGTPNQSNPDPWTLDDSLPRSRRTPQQPERTQQREQSGRNRPQSSTRRESTADDATRSRRHPLTLPPGASGGFESPQRPPSQSRPVPDLYRLKQRGAAGLSRQPQRPVPPIEGPRPSQRSTFNTQPSTHNPSPRHPLRSSENRNPGRNLILRAGYESARRENSDTASVVPLPPAGMGNRFRPGRKRSHPQTFDPDSSLLQGHRRPATPRSDEGTANRDDGKLDWDLGYRVLKSRSHRSEDDASRTRRPQSGDGRNPERRDGDDLFSDDSFGSWNGKQASPSNVENQMRKQ